LKPLYKNVRIYAMELNLKGYTLIEIVLVIAVISILSVSIFVYINYSKTFNLDAGTSKVAADLRYAQNLSMSTAQFSGVSFEGNTYFIYTTTGTEDTLVNNPADFGRSLQVDLFHDFGISIASVLIGGGNKVEFSPLGQPYSDKTGSILSTESAIILSVGSDTKTITITPNTGKVSIQ